MNWKEMTLSSNPNIKQVHMEYKRLLREYQDAKQAYEVDDSKENWDRMQELSLSKSIIKRVCLL